MRTERTSRRRSPLLIIKLGGSLARSPALCAWLDCLERHGAGRVVIVPGGGYFADAVREAQVRWKFSDVTAHDMAVLAMEQFGMMLCALDSRLRAARSRTEIARTLAAGGLPVWLPAAMLARATGIRKNWNVTSDSLAAWLARELHADHLVLVKSCRVPAGSTVAAWARAGIVDCELPHMIRGAGFTTRLVGEGDETRLREITDCGETAAAVAQKTPAGISRRVPIAQRTAAMRAASSGPSRRASTHSAPRKPR